MRSEISKKEKTRDGEEKNGEEGQTTGEKKTRNMIIITLRRHDFLFDVVLRDYKRA